MLPSTVTLVAPNGQTIVLGESGLSYVSGHPKGYLLGDDTDLDGAPLVPRRENHPAVTGGVVTPGRRDIREVELAGTIVAPTQDLLEQLKDDLSQVLGDHGPDEILVRWPYRDSTREVSGVVEGRLEFGPEPWSPTFHATVICADPIGYGPTINSVSLGSSSSPSTASNGGNADVWPTVTVTVNSGTVEGLRIGNSTVGRYVDLAGLSLSTGSEIVVVMKPGREEIKAGSTNLYGKRNRTTSRPWYLRPGNNLLYVTVTAGTATVSAVAEWRDGWVS